MTSFGLRFRPETLAELREVTSWYEAASAGLGAEFQQEFFTELDRLASATTVHRSLYRDFRRVAMPRFPYFIYFKVENGTVVIFLLIHNARDPAAAKQLLGERGAP